MPNTDAADNFLVLEALIYSNAIRGDVAAFTAAVATVPTRVLRAAYRAAFQHHLPESFTGTRAQIIARACERCRAALAVSPGWRSPHDQVALAA
jgi:hypothetical protein